MSGFLAREHPDRDRDDPVPPTTGREARAHTVDNVVVTGASGFIGRNLTASLARRNDCRVSVVVRTAQAADVFSGTGIDVHVGTFGDEAFIRRVCAEASHVFHLAGVVAPFSPAHTFHVNVEMTSRLAAGLSSLRSPPVLVYVSSLAAAGPAIDGKPRRESDRCDPRSIYGRSKLAAEEMLRTHADKLPITIVRPPAVFGAWDRNLLQLYHTVRWGIDPVGISKRFRYSLVHAEDLARGLQMAATLGRRLRPDPSQSDGVYFLADPDAVTMVDLANHVAATLGRRAPIHLTVPAPICWTMAALSELSGRCCEGHTFLNFDKMREARAGSWLCNTDRALRELGFSVDAPLRDRIAQTSAWYEQHAWI